MKAYEDFFLVSWKIWLLKEQKKIIWIITEKLMTNTIAKMTR